MSAFFGELENTIFEAIHSLVGASFFLDGIAIISARFLVYLLTLVFLGVLLVHREPYERLNKIFYSTLSLILSAGIFQSILHFMVYRTSPAASFGYDQLTSGRGGFPAFMTTWAISLAFIASFVLSKRLGFWLFIFACLIGLSQIYVGLHWPFDVAASILIGMLGPIVAWRVGIASAPVAAKP